MKWPNKAGLVGMVLAALGIAACGSSGSSGQPVSGTQSTSSTTSSGPSSSTGSSSPGSGTSTPSGSSVPSTSTTGPKTSPNSQTLVSTTILGFPAQVRPGAKVQFSAVISNPATGMTRNVGPVFQIVAGQCNCAQGSLQIQQPNQDVWQDVVMPEGDGENPLHAASHAVELTPGTKAAFQYRLTLASNTTAGPASAIVYAVQLPGYRQVGSVLQRTTIAASP